MSWSGRLGFATPTELLHSGGSGWRLPSNGNDETHVRESGQAMAPCMSSTRLGAVYKPTYKMTVRAVTVNTELKTVAKETQNMDVSELVRMLLKDRRAQEDELARERERGESRLRQPTQRGWMNNWK